MAAPAFRSKNALSYASRASPSVCPAPAGIADGDILIAVALSGNGAGAGVNALTPPAGWTAVAAATEVSQGGFWVGFQIFWKRAAAESGSYSFAHNASATRSTEIAIAAYSGGLASGSPIDAFSRNSGVGTLATALSITTTVADVLLVIGDHNWAADGSHVPPSGFTERHKILTTINDAVQAVAGASGNKGPYSSGTPVAGDPWQSWMLALKPVVAAGGAASGKPKVRVGSSWVEKPAKVWSGSAWVTKPVKVWTGSAWKTVGGAAPTGPTASMMVSFTPTTERNDFTGEVGVRINMTASRSVSWLGVRCGTGDTGVHRLNLYEWFADVLVATVTVDLTGKTVGTFYWAPITPVTLTSGYYALLKETVASDGQYWAENAPTVFSATYTGNIYATYRMPGGSMAVTGSDLQFVGVDLGW